MILGIDATHITGGGSLRHLKLLLENFNNFNTKISKIYIWAPLKTLNLLNKNKNIIKLHYKIFEYNFIFKALWQIFFLKKNLKKFNCNILFVPSGIFYINFKPTITMAQNLMPFNADIVKKHFPYILFFKMILQKYLFIRSFNKASKIIFLSKFSKNYINFFLNVKSYNQLIIPHAIDLKLIKFFQNKKIPNKLKYKKEIKICLLSDINFNKNYADVLNAMSLLKKQYNIQFFWVGGYNQILLKKFNKLKKNLNRSQNYIFYKGLLSHTKTMTFLKKCDIFLYSSYCETFGMAVLEAMSSKLPIVILNHPLYKDILGSNAFFFKNNNIKSLKTKLVLAIDKTFKHKPYYKKNINLLKYKYNPQKMALHTFKALENAFLEYNYQNKILK
jgi:glycosyltransferase involved in cell wall biosynthesis